MFEQRQDDLLYPPEVSLENPLERVWMELLLRSSTSAYNVPVISRKPEVQAIITQWKKKKTFKNVIVCFLLLLITIMMMMPFAVVTAVVVNDDSNNGFGCCC